MSTSSKINDLKLKTDDFLRENLKNPQKISGSEIRSLVSELNLGLLELEIQNQILLNDQAQGKLGGTHSGKEIKTTGTGRFSINSFGYIIEGNRACAEMLGIEQGSLTKTKIFKYIKRESKKPFNQHCQKVLELSARQNCQVKLINRGGTEIPIRLQSITGIDQDGNRVINCELVVDNKLF